MPRRKNMPHPEEGREVCLGLVIVPQPGELAAARHQLGQLEEVELGEPQAHRVPACVMTTIGQDERLLARIEALSAVLKAEVAYAEVLEEQLP